MTTASRCGGPRQGRFRVDVDRALRAIETRPAATVRQATSAWASTQGWCPSLAGHVADGGIGFVAVHDAYASTGAESSAAASMCSTAGRLVVPLRYPDGQVWGVATRGQDEGEWQVQTADDPGPSIVGNVPAAVDRCSDVTPLVVATDPLVAMAVSAAGLPVVAGLDADRMGSVLGAIRDYIADTEAEIPLVVLATDEDTARRVATLAADRVVGATAVRWGVLRAWSAPGVQAALDGAREAPGAPLPLGEARVELMRLLTRLADPAHADAATPATLDLVIADTGVGKSYAFDRVAAERQRLGDRVGVLTSSIAAAEEHRARIAAADGVPMLAKGALKLCFVFENATKAARTAINRRFEMGGREALCEDCVYKVGCPGAVAPRLSPDVVTLAAHQSAMSLCRPPPKDAPLEQPGLLFIDECPRPIDGQEPTPRGRVHDLLLCPNGAQWRSDMTRDEASTLRAVIDGLDNAAGHLQRTHPSDHAVRWPLAHALDKLPSLASWMAERVDCPWVAPPMCESPTPDEVRSNGAEGHPDAQAVALVIDIVRAVQAAREGVEPPEHCGGIDLKVDGTGWTLESSTPLSLPPDARIVIADAAAEHRIAEYEALTKFNGRTLRVHRIRVEHTQTVACIHVAGQCFRGPELRTGFDTRGERRLKASAPATIRRAFVMGLVPLVPRFVRGRRITVGVLTYKQVATALRGEDTSPEGVEIATMVRRLEALGFHLDVGHFGAHDTGTNRWASADGLFILGDGSEELGEAHRHARILGVDAATLYDGRLNAALVQRVGRARLMQRLDDPPGVVVAATRVAPVPAVTWNEHPVSRGNAPSLDHVMLAVHAARVVERHGHVHHLDLSATTGLGGRYVERHLPGVAEAMGLVKTTMPKQGGRGRARVVYVPAQIHCAASASALAAREW